MSADDARPALLSQFTAHRRFTGIEHLDASALIDVLLQRRLLSLLLPVVYDIGIDGLDGRDRDQARAGDPARGVSGRFG